MAKRVKELFSPCAVGRVELKNRLVMLPHGTHMARNSEVSEQQLRYYTERARGGVGLVIVGSLVPSDISEANVERADRRDPLGTRLGIWSDEQLPSLRQLAKAVHDSGARVGAQIQMEPEWVAEKGGRLEGRGASDEPAAHFFPPLRGVTVEEIHQIVEEHAEAARRAREAGFDLVEFMTGIGYFLSRFLSARSNRRTDQYGGSIENRVRILLEIIDRAKEKAGSDYTYICRLSAHEFVEGGNTLQDTKRIAPILEKAGSSQIVSPYGPSGRLSWPPPYHWDHHR